VADSNAQNTFKRYGVRKRVWEKGNNVTAVDVAEAVRDVDGELGKIYPRQIVETTTQYTPPQPFTVSCDHNPWGVICIRIRADKGSSRDVIASGGGQCNFEWAGDVLKIYGVGSFITPGRYIFTLEIIG
jgi:hypothetical protein